MGGFYRDRFSTILFKCLDLKIKHNGCKNNVTFVLKFVLMVLGVTHSVTQLKAADVIVTRSQSILKKL